ncbi:Hypothetical predicted protein [Paramuricea clavata]|uniref:Uncharacterized protein n=1 Tax=Paramuricea clavata TaxID=317549 RepID=A0A7D9I870_PARCT|nr:Hypothetical predicted protein [Paramuricea clavata]
MQEDEWFLDKLMTIFQQELEARERANLQCLPSSNSSYQRNKPATATALFEGLHDTTCSYGQGQHLSANCKIVTNVAARRDILKRSGRCFVCLRKNVLVRKANRTSNVLNVVDDIMEVCAWAANLDKNSPTLTHQPTSKNLSIHVSLQQRLRKGKKLELVTAKVNIYKPGMQENRVNARFILDSGSQRSFVTTRVKNQLNLDADIFGDQAEKLQICEFLHFNIEAESTYPDISLLAFVVPTICQPLRHQTTQAAQEIYHSLKGLNLEDLDTG